MEDFSSLQSRTGTITKCTSTNVLYSRALGNTRLFSWTTARRKFRRDAQGNDIFLSPKDDVSRRLLWTKYRRGSFEIQTSENGSAVFAAYGEFHEASRHSHVSTTTA